MTKYKKIFLSILLSCLLTVIFYQLYNHVVRIYFTNYFIEIVKSSLIILGIIALTRYFGMKNKKTVFLTVLLMMITFLVNPIYKVKDFMPEYYFELFRKNLGNIITYYTRNTIDGVNTKEIEITRQNQPLIINWANQNDSLHGKLSLLFSLKAVEN